MDCGRTRFGLPQSYPTLLGCRAICSRLVEPPAFAQHGSDWSASCQADLPLYYFAEPSLNGEAMSSLKEFRCEICGIVSENPIHWFVIECTDQKLAVIKWDLTAAASPTARHYCGEAHAQVYISRWFESVCIPPPKQVLKAI